MVKLSIVKSRIRYRQRQLKQAVQDCVRTVTVSVLVREWALVCGRGGLSPNLVTLSLVVFGLVIPSEKEHSVSCYYEGKGGFRPLSGSGNSQDSKGLHPGPTCL